MTRTAWTLSIIGVTGLCVVVMLGLEPNSEPSGLKLTPLAQAARETTDGALLTTRPVEALEKSSAQGSHPDAHSPNFEPADFRTAVYGNPYKAVLDARAWSPRKRDTLYSYVRQRCALVQVKLLERQGLASKPLPPDPTGELAQALTVLEAQCLPFMQDHSLQDLTAQARRRLSHLSDRAGMAGVAVSSLPDAPLDAWVDDLYVDMNLHKRSGDPKYFSGVLWAGLDGPEHYNRAVTQAFFNLMISPDASTPHLESLYHCVRTGACGIPANLLAVHDLPVDMQARVLAISAAIEREIVAGNSAAFDPPKRP